MRLLSPVFEHGSLIPQEYTCDGQNMSPPLLIADVPENAKSLSLIMEDPDVPTNLRPDGLFIHWMVWDMEPNVTEIPESAEAPGIIGENTAGRASYTGPCPPDREHRYFFRLYALDIRLTEARIASKQDFLKAMEGHIVAEAELMGKYKRNVLS